MKTYTLTLTEDEAHALGRTLIREISRQKTNIQKGFHLVSKQHTKNLLMNLERCYNKLDTARE